MVLQAWGVDVRSLAIVLSVVGVGIGFGLQNIANNFVSGLLLNLGRAVRAGDYVHVGTYVGTVTRIGARSTEILTTDQVAVLVPNSRFLENEVVNWSHGDPLSRIRVPVGVAYGSDAEQARQALLEAARGHASVAREPRPQVQMRRFGESSLDFELLVWTRKPRDQQQLVSDLNFRVERSLRRHGVHIPFPQRDLHLHAPALERTLDAWRRGDVQAQPTPADPSVEESLPGPEARWDRGPEDWDVAELEAVVGELCGEGGIEVRDRRHRLVVFPSCFVGSEAVEWLVHHRGLGRSEAVRLGRRLVELGLVHHVLDEHDFRDGHYFYRFGNGHSSADGNGS